MAAAVKALPAATALALSQVLTGRRCAYCSGSEDSVGHATLPSWLLRSLSAPGTDVSRQEKIRAFTAAQESDAAVRSNAAVPPAPRTGDPCRMRVVSFNVHFMRDNYGKDNRARVLEVLRELDADVVGFQEVVLPREMAAAGGRPAEGMLLLKPSDNIEANMQRQWQDMDRAFGFDVGAIRRSLPRRDGNEGVGEEFLDGLRELGYCHCVYSPGFFATNCAFFCGNAVFSRRPFVESVEGSNRAVVLDEDRYGETRSAAVASVPFGIGAVTVASTHLDAWAEARGQFGLAEGELVRILEFEALHDSTRHLRNVVVVGDFNAGSRLASSSSELHAQVSHTLDQASLARDAKTYRHYLPRDRPRLRDEWCLTALGFAEGRLGYAHCWQLRADASQRLPPLYSHWSGQCIDHCLLRGWTQSVEVSYAGVYHSGASDHLPLVVDLEVPAP